MQHRLKYTHTSGASTLTSTVTEEGDGEDNREVDVLTATNVEIDLDFDKDKVKMFFLTSDRDVTVRTNANDGTADDIFSVGAGVPLVWHATGPAALIFTEDVTKLFIQNASGATAAVRIRLIQDSTP